MMKKKKEIVLKDPRLRQLTIQLRKVILMAVYLKIKKEDRKYSDEMNDLRLAQKASICICKECVAFDKDMVFMPTLDGFLRGWYCKDCAPYYDWYLLHRMPPASEEAPAHYYIRNGQTIMRIMWGILEHKEGEEFILKPPDAEFIVNDYLMLQLRDGRILLFVGDEQFTQCISLFFLLNEGETASQINSIDEAEQIFGDIHNKKHFITSINLRDVFWGHCSNLQAWYENNYDTRLLHRNLAFPLLKRLTELGDLLAIKVFKEEIAKRYSSGFFPVVEYLKQEGYLNYLTDEELNASIAK